VSAVGGRVGQRDGSRDRDAHLVGDQGRGPVEILVGAHRAAVNILTRGVDDPVSWLHEHALRTARSKAAGQIGEIATGRYSLVLVVNANRSKQQFVRLRRRDGGP